MAISTAPDHTGISVRIIDLKADGSLPEAPYTGAIPIGHMDEFNNVLSATREVKKYTPVNDKDYEQIVSTGALQYGELNATVLYDFNASDGANKAREAFFKNEPIGLIIIINDPQETTIARIVKLSEFSINGEKDGKMSATIRAESIGDPIITKKATQGE